MENAAVKSLGSKLEGLTLTDDEAAVLKRLFERASGADEVVGFGTQIGGIPNRMGQLVIGLGLDSKGFINDGTEPLTKGFINDGTEPLTKGFINDGTEPL